MPYRHELKELLGMAAKLPVLIEFTGAEIAWVRFRTDRDVVARLLPRPLRVPERAMGRAFVARYPTTNFGATYREGALFVDAEYKGEVGSYCLAMPVDDDMAMVAGREGFGYPKKMAQRIDLDVRDGHVVASVVRKDVELIRIEGDLTVPVTPEGLEDFGVPATDPDGRACRVAVQWLFKYFPDAGNGVFQGAPLLVREALLFRPRPGQLLGNLDMKLLSSPADPVGEIPVGEIVAAGYGTFDNTMLPGRVVKKIRNRYDFVPKALFKYDWYDAMDFDQLPDRSLRGGLRLRRQLREY